MPASSGNQRLLFGLALLAATFVAYIPAIRSGFVWDDNIILTDNPLMTAPGGLLSFWFSTRTPDYFPLSSSMLWFEWKIFGLDHPWGYHASNIAIHTGSSLVLWRLFLRLGIPAAGFAALLFALHPVNVEAVAWIAQRKSTLSLFFALLAALFFFKSEDTPSPGDKHRPWHYGTALLCFLLALLAKTSVAMLPVALLLLLWWRSGSLDRAGIVRLLPFFALAGVLSLVTIWFQHNISIGDDIIREDGFLSRLALSGWAIWFYLYKALAPLDLSFMYPRWEANLSNPLTWLPLFLVILSLIGLWRLRARPWARASFTAFAIYIAMLFPVLGFFNIYFMLYSLVADHWQYPAIPAVIALLTSLLVAVAARLDNKAPARGLAALLLGIFAILTWNLARDYKDEDTLWHATIGKNPAAWCAHQELGANHAERGQYQEAIRHARLALQIVPDRGVIHNNLATALANTNQVEEAFYHNHRALELTPELAMAWYLEGNLLSQTGKKTEAIAHYRRCIELDPSASGAYANLGGALRSTGQTEEAIAYSLRALELDPDLIPPRYNLALIFLEQGRMREARIHFEAAIQALPDHVITLRSLAWILATAPGDDLRDGARAVGLASRANRLAANNPEVLRALAAALAETGRFKEAIAVAQQGMLLASTGNIPALAVQIRVDLESYKKGLPLRDQR